MNSGATLREGWIIEAGKRPSQEGMMDYIWVAPRNYAPVLTKLSMDKNEICYMNFSWDANNSSGVNDILVRTWKLLFIDIKEKKEKLMKEIGEQVVNTTGVKMSVIDFMRLLKDRME